MQTKITKNPNNQKEASQFAVFQKSYLEFLARIEEIRKRQLILLQETAKKVDSYKLSQLKIDN